MASVAFFDLDRTLISVNSATGWIRREMRLGYLSKRQAMMGAWWIGKYQLGFAHMEEAISDAVATLAGEEEAVVRARTYAFWEEAIAGRIRPGARLAVDRHREQGDHLAILTSSSTYMCEVAGRAFGIEHWGCNRFEVQDGVFTGTVHQPLCFGAGKVEHARRIADDLGADLEQCAFYTDSYSDLPGLEAVGRPVVVAPDPRLQRLAKARGWEIQDWGG